MAQVTPHSLFTDFDIDLFKAGKHYRLYGKLGSHLIEHQGTKGCYFAVWAPSAKSVSLIGDFNHWTAGEHELLVRWDGSGIWEGFVPGLDQGTKYKYSILSHNNGIRTEKADPFARYSEHTPKTASLVWESPHTWRDEKWMQGREENNGLDRPYSVYEVHLGSWRKKNGWEYLSYLEMADQLVDYVANMGFTHVELMPVMEYPYDPSWGYQITGYFAPTSRFGRPEDFKTLVDRFHQRGIGVILDWVPSHFPEDAHGLGQFDGSHLYEHPDPRRGYHPDWKSLIFNYGRNEVRAFLISNAIYWLDEFHVDGLRVDAVASMLYLDYSREAGEWEPNIYGNNENLEALSFLREMNREVYASFKGVQTIAEESTAFGGVTKPVHYGGLGFGMKWMMGWMHDTLDFFKKDPIHRSHDLNEITFSMTYAFTENFMLPFSHDEVVHGKNSLVYRMPGDEWQRFANLRLMLGYMFTHPGGKLLFMGCEFGQTSEWNFQQGLEWHLTKFGFHAGIQEVIKDLNQLYREQPALYEKQFSEAGFQWIEYNDRANTVISFIRKGHNPKDDLIVVLNFTPVPREGHRVGVPKTSKLKLLFNSDGTEYSGSGLGLGDPVVEAQPWNGHERSMVIDLPPLAVVVYR